jgi:single stranded DNA-binding protein
MNQVTLYGHVGKDGELKYVGSGSAVLGFTLATEEVWHDDAGEKHKKTEWHKCVAWRKLAEALAPYAKKGAALILIGRVETRSWEGKDGKKNYMTEVVIKQAGAPIIIQREKAAKSANDEGDALGPDEAGPTTAENDDQNDLGF